MKFKQLPINIKIKLIGSFFNRCIYSATLPFIALYLTENMDAKTSSVFLIVNVIIQYFGNLFGGYVVDRYPRKIVLFYSTLFESISLFILWLTVIYSFIIIFMIIFILFTISSSFRRPSLSAIVQDSANKNNKKLIYRIDYWLTNLSLSIGSLIGALLYSGYKEYLFLSMAIISLTLCIIYNVFINETKKFIDNKKHNSLVIDLLKSYKEVIIDKRFMILIIGSMLLASTELMIATYIAVRLNNNFNTINILGLTIDGIRMFSIINLVSTVSIVLFSLIISEFMENFRSDIALFIGLLLYGVGYTCLTSANIWWIIILCTLIANFGEMIFIPIKNSEQLSLIPKNKKGSYNSIRAIAYNGSSIIANSMLFVGYYLSPPLMSLLVLLIVMVGGYFTFHSFFVFKLNQVKKEKNT